MVMTHAAIIGTATKLAGLYILLSVGIVFFRVATGNGYIRAPVRATFVSQIALRCVIQRNEIEDRPDLLALHFERPCSTQSSTIGNDTCAGG
jgi:hypothetical protein